MEMSIPTKALVLGILVLISGCAGTASQPTAGDFEEGMELINKEDPDGDGRYSDFDINVRVDSTELDTHVLKIWVNGVRWGTTNQIEANGQYSDSFELNDTQLARIGQANLTVTVGVAETDMAENETLRSWSDSIQYESPETTEPPKQESESNKNTNQTDEDSEESDVSETGDRGPSEGTEWTVTVTRVVDGDTVEVRFPNGETDTLRLLGVDTPETSFGSVTPSEFEGISDGYDGQDHLFNWGEKATTYAEDKLSGKEIRIEVDDKADRRGYYGRLLVYIYVDGENFNKQLLTNGYARVYESDFSKLSEFEAAESQAQTDNVGLWDYTAPSSGESDSEDKSTSDTETDDSSSEVSVDDLYVSDVHADADGNDHENLNDEYITLSVFGSGSLDVGGWTVEDEAGHTYTFPSGFEITGDEPVTLYTGSDSDSDTSLYWGSDSAIWNNGGDTVIIKDDSGETIVEHGY